MSYTPPPGDPPPAPPPAGAPPAGAPPAGLPQGWQSYASAPALAPAERPGMVTAAGITMIVLGALITLFGLIVLVVGGVIGGAAGQFESQLPGFGGTAGAFAAIFIVLAVIILAIGILDIVGGAKVLSGRSWARILGIVVATVLGVLGLLSVFGSSTVENSNPAVELVLVAANAFIVFALVTSGRWFGPRAAS